MSKRTGGVDRLAGAWSGFSRQGVGSMLLYDAISRLANAPIGVHALCANAIDEGAVAFYQAHQFTRFALRINARMHAKGGEAL